MNGTNTHYNEDESQKPGRAPAYQVFPGDDLSDERVQLLSLEEFGALELLKRFCWKSGSLPNDADQLARLCWRCPVDVIMRVVHFFAPSAEHGRLIYPEHEQQRLKHEQFRRRQALNGAKGGRPSELIMKETQNKGLGLSGETQNKGLGLSGETQMKPKKRSSSSSSSSSSSFNLLSEEKEQATTFAFTALAVPAQTFISLPLADRSIFDVSTLLVEEWKKLYPGIDVGQQLRNYRAHFDAQPKNRKTKTGILKSVVYWLSEAQNRSHGARGGIGPDSRVGIYDAPAVITQDTQTDPTPKMVDAQVACQVWNGMASALAKVLSVQSFGTWVKPIAAIGVVDGELWLEIPSENFSHVARRYEFKNYLPQTLRGIRCSTAKGRAA